MKILLLTGKMENGGAETHVYDLGAELVSRGHEVTLVSSGGRIADGMEKLCVRCERTTLHRRSVIGIVRACLALRRILSETAPDVVHAHTRLSALVACGLCRKRGIPMITTAHAKFRKGIFADRLSRWGDRTIAVGQDIKQYLVSQAGLRADRVSVILNGVDTDRFSPSGESEEKRICFLSRLDGDCSAAAIALCRIAHRLTEGCGDVSICIGGDGDSFDTVLQEAKEANKRTGRETVRLYGRVESVPEFLRGAWVFVGVSRAAIEAMSCGVPAVLAGNEGFLGVAEGETLDRARLSNYCCRGESALCEQSLFLSLCSVLSRNGSERERLRAQSRNYALENHSSAVMAERTEKIYESVLKSREREKRIVLCGYYGYGNLGDDALLDGAIARARREYFGCEVVALTKNGRSDKPRFGISCVRRTNIFAVAGEIKKAHAVVFGGGTLLQNGTSRRSLAYYLNILRYAHKREVSTVLWGNGIGMIDGDRQRRATACVLSRCDRVGLRDDCSVREAGRLSEQYSVNIHTVREDDIAEGTGACDGDRLEYLLSRLGISGGDRVLAVSVRGEEGRGYRAMLERYVSRAAAAGDSILYIPMFPRQDLKASVEMMERYGGRIAYPVGVADAVGLIGRADQVVSQRYHALVFARTAGVPYVAIGSLPKLDSFM